MNDKRNYFKIGSFVLIGLSLIVFALLIFGSHKLFEPTIYVETYFEESVQGVSAGTPVKYRGLKIGYVKKIEFTNEIYDAKEIQTDTEMHNRSIYIRIAITSRLFTDLTNEQLKKFIAEEVAHGLRFKITAQGVTGNSYLELNYIDPKTSTSYAITWQPHDLYIPSATSTLTKLSESAQYIMNEIKDIDFKKIFNDINTLTLALTKTAAKTDTSLSQINNPLGATIQNAKIISDNLRLISSQLKLNPSSMVFGKSPPTLNPSKL